VTNSAADRRDVSKLMDQLYERYGKPLEKDHWGEFLAVTEDGRKLLADDYLQAAERGEQQFAPSLVYLFRVGEVAVGRVG
jgi:hypothetical protein